MTRILILMVSFLAISAAGPASPARASDADDTFRAITKASVYDHIIPRYELLATAGTGLETATTAYCQDRTAQNFTALDTAFRNYWIAWAGIRHIQFGPVQFLNRGFRIQFWPDTRNKIGRQLSRVLAAEDNEVNRRVLAAFLEPLGADLVIACDGEEALEAFERGPFDLVLMDIQMPRLDGVEATKAIRARERESGANPTRIVALTANAMAHQVETCLNAGMDDHLAKPLTQAALLRLIADAAKGAPPGRKRDVA